MQREFWTLKDAFSNFSIGTLTEIRTLSFHGEGGPGWEGRWWGSSGPRLAAQAGLQGGCSVLGLQRGVFVVCGQIPQRISGLRDPEG